MRTRSLECLHNAALASLSELHCQVSRKSRLTLVVDCHGAGASTLCLAAGKAAGMVAVWESGPLAKDSCGAPCVSQQRAYSNKAHGSMAVTGVSWARCCPSPLHVPGSSQDGQALLCTTGLDGGVKAWRWQKDQVMPRIGPAYQVPLSAHFNG